MKKVTESYLFDSLSFTESEGRCIEEMTPFISGEFTVSDIKRANYSEIFFSDEESALMIQENPYLQYFCGYPGYDDEKLPFDPSLMVYFRKRLTPEVLGEINEMIVRDAKERQVKEAESKDDDDDSDGQPGTGGNSGTMIVDATCAPSNIRYPQDVSLLNEARENAETLLDVLHDPAGGKASNLPQTRPERLPEIHKMP